MKIAKRFFLLCFAAIFSVAMIAISGVATPPLGGPEIRYGNHRLNFYCFLDSFPMGFSIVGLGDETCRLWIESDLPISHTLNTEIKYTESGNYGSCRIKVLEPPEVQHLPRNPGYDSFRDYQYAYIYLKGDHDIEKRITVINTQYGLFAGVTNEESLFYYACRRIKEWEETGAVLAAILTVVLIAVVVGFTRTAIKRKKARARFAAMRNPQVVVKKNPDPD